MATISELERELERLKNINRSKQDLKNIQRRRKKLMQKIRQEKRPKLQMFKRALTQARKDIVRVSKVSGEASVLLTKDILRRIDENQKREAAKRKKKLPVKKRRVVKRKRKK